MDQGSGVLFVFMYRAASPNVDFGRKLSNEPDSVFYSKIMSKKYTCVTHILQIVMSIYAKLLVGLRIQVFASVTRRFGTFKRRIKL